MKKKKASESDVMTAKWRIHTVQANIFIKSYYSSAHSGPLSGYREYSQVQFGSLQEMYDSTSGKT